MSYQIDIGICKIPITLDDQITGREIARDWTHQGRRSATDVIGELAAENAALRRECAARQAAIATLAD